jgi:hypothetical protein
MRAAFIAIVALLLVFVALRRRTTIVDELVHVSAECKTVRSYLQDLNSLKELHDFVAQVDLLHTSSDGKYRVWRLLEVVPLFASLTFDNVLQVEQTLVPKGDVIAHRIRAVGTVVSRLFDGVQRYKFEQLDDEQCLVSDRFVIDTIGALSLFATHNGQQAHRKLLDRLANRFK